VVSSPTASVADVSGTEVPTAQLRWYFAFFVISGFCGLVYEVIWVRLAMASFGVNTALISIVLSIFMAGLGIGSWGARFIQQRGLASPSVSLRLYAAVEFFIGLSSLAVPFELKLGRQVLLHAQGFGAWQTSGYFAVAGCMVALALLPWCACMGATFPLLMAVIRRTTAAESKFSFSYLYIANVLGALLGTLISAYVLIELLGFRRTLFVAGVLNVLIAALAFRLSVGLRPASATAVTSETAASASDSRVIPADEISGQQRLYGLPRSACLVLLFTTGLVSMGSEVVWIRQFTPYLGTVVYAFAEILAIYLLGTLVGSWNYRQWLRSHAQGESGRKWTLLALAAVLPVAAADPLLPFPLRVFAIAPFCALAGFVTPLLVDSWSAGDPDRGGSAYAVNIAGCLLGPLFASFVLLPAVGERWTLVVFCIPLFCVAGLISLKEGAQGPEPRTRLRSSIAFALAVLIAAGIVLSSHDFETAFAARRVKRDYTATVIATGTGFQRKLLVNGIGMTNLSPVTKYMAHLPLSLLPTPPRNGLVICFGMGTTFRSMVSWGIPTTAVDLVPSVPAMFDYFHADAAQVRDAPDAHIVTDDGRRFLDGSTESFDVVVVDPPPPVQAAGSSLLYSREFYGVIKRHLRKNGLLVQWYPDFGDDAGTTSAIAKALVESFPYVRAYRAFDRSMGIHFLASMEPIIIPSSDVLALRMPPRAAADFVEWGPARDPKDQFDLVLSQEISMQSLLEEDPRIPTLTDDRPINEYYLLRSRLGFDR
jgi:spermidine synthase